MKSFLQATYSVSSEDEIPWPTRAEALQQDAERMTELVDHARVECEDAPSFRLPTAVASQRQTMCEGCERQEELSLCPGPCCRWLCYTCRPFGRRWPLDKKCITCRGNPWPPEDLSEEEFEEVSVAKSKSKRRKKQQQVQAVVADDIQ